MPRINAPTLAQHRDMRRTSLLDAGRDITLTQGPKAVTMAAVAARAGLSRPAVYEYFTSREALLGQLLTAEMEQWSAEITAVTTAEDSPDGQVRSYVTNSLRMLADGRHRLASLITPADIDEATARGLMVVHHQLAAPLVRALAELGVADAEQAAMLLQGVIQAAGRRIESGSDVATETSAALAFVMGGIGALSAA